MPGDHILRKLFNEWIHTSLIGIPSHRRNSRIEVDAYFNLGIHNWKTEVFESALAIE